MGSARDWFDAEHITQLRKKDWSGITRTSTPCVHLKVAFADPGDTEVLFALRTAPRVAFLYSYQIPPGKKDEDHRVLLLIVGDNLANQRLRGMQAQQLQDLLDTEELIPVDKATSSSSAAKPVQRTETEIHALFQSTLLLGATSIGQEDQKNGVILNIRHFLATRGREKQTWDTVVGYFSNGSGRGNLIIHNALLVPKEVQETLFRPLFAQIAHTILTHKDPKTVAARIRAFDNRAWSAMMNLLPTDTVAQLCALAKQHSVTELSLLCGGDVMTERVARAYSNSFRKHFHGLTDCFLWLVADIAPPTVGDKLRNTDPADLVSDGGTSPADTAGSTPLERVLRFVLLLL